MTVANLNRPAALDTPVKTWRPYWWVYPAWVVVALSAFGAYALWACLQGTGTWGPYLSPFYSPPIPGIPNILKAFAVAWIPLGFRASCYYYRKSYYRSFFRQPPACAVDGRSGKYNGETGFPWVFNNIHRYFLYLTIIVLVFLWYDAITAFWYHDQVYIGLGSAIMLVNVCLLSAYSFGCHALRNLVGGGVNCYSCSLSAKCKHGTWKFVGLLNGRHAMYAWISMFTVGFADIYIRCLISGAFTDPHITF